MIQRNFPAALAALPPGVKSAIRHFVASGFPVQYAPNREPKTPTGSMGATGLFTNHDYLTDTLFDYLFVVSIEGEDSPSAMILEGSLKNIGRWLARHPIERLDSQHGQSLPALGPVGLLFSDEEILTAFFRWAATLPNNRMLSTRVGMTTRAWLRFHAMIARAAGTLTRIARHSLAPIPDAIDPGRILEAAGDSIMALEGWAQDRATPGKKGEEGRGFTTELDRPWSLREAHPRIWPYWSGDADFIGFHDQPFMYTGVLGHSIAWFLAEGTPIGRATRIRLRELATWALWSFYDPATNTALEAIPRGTFRPTMRHRTNDSGPTVPALHLPFSSWGALDRQLEGELHHSLAGVVLGATVARGPRARLLRRMLGTNDRPEDSWLQRGEIESASVIAWQFLTRGMEGAEAPREGEETFADVEKILGTFDLFPGVDLRDGQQPDGETD